MTWAREGDEDAYREMLRRYGPPVFDLIYRMVGQRELAEDLAQETFVKAFRALDHNGPERKPSAWILRIATLERAWPPTQPPRSVASALREQMPLWSWQSDLRSAHLGCSRTNYRVAVQRRRVSRGGLLRRF